ncbi:heme-binding beta-barrel domain-containing protein [Devosia rhizoryzae]|uniref:FABP family protein n=1 Tax=Devosia rhizoryzae TaxID=2774137 RepID=A0ABX7C8D2_9HYPH|nr:heme-binding beta-barrel domain-containing protein [Devosia rhizoryzae]QQR39539.1 FABP family protein [Devosia rhizoryzae]
MTMRLLRVVLAALVLQVAAMVPSFAQDQMALLNTYIGDWRGESALIGGDRNEPFRCRLSVAQGDVGKINYTGRCTLVNATLSISGTIAYKEDQGRYEAAMSSNAGYTGLAVGRVSGDTISFDLREQAKDRAGSDVRIGAKIVLVRDTIQVDFEVEFNESGEVLTAAVPFSR